MHAFLLALLLACGSSGRSVAELEAAKAEIKPFQKWEEARGRITAVLGEPDADADNKTIWYGKDGDKCMVFSVTHAAGTVGTINLKPGEGCP